MDDFNKSQFSCDQSTVSSSYFEITGPDSKIADSTHSSACVVLKHSNTASDVRPDGRQSTEESVCSKPIVSVTSLCLTCHFRNIKTTATHFCHGCDQYGRYMCDKCLREHNMWCCEPEHVVHSLSVDRWLNNGTNEESKHTTTDVSDTNYVDNYCGGSPSTESHEPYNLINQLTSDDFDSDEEIYQECFTETESSPWILHEEKKYSNLIKRSTNIHEAYHRPGTTSHIYNWPFDDVKSNRTVSDSFDWDPDDTDTLKRLGSIYKEKEHKKKFCIIS